MPGAKPEDFDFPMSEDYRKFVSETRAVTLKKKKTPTEGRVTGKKKVAGMMLNQIEGPLDEGNAAAVLENLRTMGISPENSNQKKGETASQPEMKPTKQPGREPRKIKPKWINDQESFLQIDTDPQKRQRALNSDAVHDRSVRMQELRKSWGLPKKAAPWKELMKRFNGLTKDEIAILKDMGYRPDWVTNPHSLTVERMIHDLDEYKKSLAPHPVTPQS